MIGSAHRNRENNKDKEEKDDDRDHDDNGREGANVSAKAATVTVVVRNIAGERRVTAVTSLVAGDDGGAAMAKAPYRFQSSLCRGGSVLLVGPQ